MTKIDEMIKNFTRCLAFKSETDYFCNKTVSESKNLLEWLNRKGIVTRILFSRMENITYFSFKGHYTWYYFSL